MYADRPRSRIAREFFYILNAMKDHYKALLRLREEDPVLIGRLLTLLAIYMLREEGLTIFRRQDIIRETQLPRSSVYKIINEFVEEEILEEKLGEFTCLSKTPEFLLNPEELYGRPLQVVQEKNYEVEEQVREALRSFSEKIPELIRVEMGNMAANAPAYVEPEKLPPVLPKPAVPKMPDLLDEVKEKKGEDEEEELEDEVEDFLM